MLPGEPGNPGRFPGEPGNPGGFPAGLNASLFSSLHRFVCFAVAFFGDPGSGYMAVLRLFQAPHMRSLCVVK